MDDSLSQRNISQLTDLPQWDLSILYRGPEDPAIDKDCAKYEEKCQLFAKKYEGKIDILDAKELLLMLEEMEDISCLENRLGAYISLRVAQNRNDKKRVKLQSNIRERIVKANTPLVFFTLEITKIPSENLDRFFQENPSLARYKTFFDALSMFKPYQLSAELEHFLHDRSVVGRTAWMELFDEIINAVRFDIDGEVLNLEATLNLMTDKNRKKREKSARALAKTLDENKELFARIHNTLAKEKEIVDRWRGMPSPMFSRHLSNQIEPETVEALRDAVVGAYPRLSHRYYKLKTKWLGLDVMDVWDRSAPLHHDDNQLLTWAQAREVVLSAYAEFDPSMADIGEKFFTHKWIDATLSDGKTPGAFSHPTSTDANPFILLNYMGKPRDVMTLAHELGHGIHQYLAANQGAILAQTPLTLAETASVFGEMLTFQKLLASMREDRSKKALLANKTEDMLNTLVRQIAFYDFEVKLHKARAKGELAPEEINELWMSIQRDSLGPSFQFMEGYGTFWAYIPHFIHSPFYVYAYAFGNGLVNALYALYAQGFENFAQHYRALLQAGGSKPYYELLKPFGLNARESSFWNLGLEVVSSMIDQLEELE